MIKKLGWIALTGFAVGFASLIAAYAAGGKDFVNARNLKQWAGDTCSSGSTDATETERRLSWTGGDTVRLAGSGTVRYRAGEGDDVVVRGPADVIAHMKIKGNTIALECNSFGTSPGIEITLPGRTFREIASAGAADLIMENVNQPALELSIAGSGSVQARGAIDHVEVKIMGSGSANLGDLKMKSLDISVMGSGDAEASPTEEADVTIAGSGKIKLLTRPARLDSKISGSGRIIHAPRNPGNES